jgi:hypothetical protein
VAYTSPVSSLLACLLYWLALALWRRQEGGEGRKGGRRKEEERGYAVSEA